MTEELTALAPSTMRSVDAKHVSTTVKYYTSQVPLVKMPADSTTLLLEMRRLQPQRGLGQCRVVSSATFTKGSLGA